MSSAEVTDVGATGKNYSQSQRMHGRPCVRDLRITVADVLGLLSAGQSRASILDDYPYLEDADLEGMSRSVLNYVGPTLPE